jgi:hypothetical protein
MGMKRCVMDPCTYTLVTRTNGLILLAIFVDDVIVCAHSRDMGEWEEKKQVMMSRFKVKEIGEIEWVLQMKVQRDREKRTITIDQERYIEKMMGEYNMGQCRTEKSPSTALNQLLGLGDPTEAEQKEMRGRPYINLIGSLLYASISTRLDTSHAVGILSRFMSKPKEAHWVAGKKVLRYLAGTKGMGLTLGGRTQGEEMVLTAYADADWAGDITSMKSTTGYVVMLNGSVISWSSKRQPTVATSTAEAEYIAMYAAIQEVQWARQLLEEWGLRVQRPTIVYSDNRAAVAIGTNDVHHTMKKHMKVKYHYVKETVESGDNKLVWIETKEQLADILTKPLAIATHTFLRDKLMG